MLPQSWVERIFEVMAAHYGARFADLWSEVDAATVKAVWAQELGRLRPAQIRRGIESLGECRLPPTLAQFAALCKQATPHAHLPKLPAPRPSAEEREQGRQRFAAMKQALARTQTSGT